MTKIIYNNMTGLTYSTENYKEFKETGNKNIFEDVIDRMILEEVAGMNETFRNAISSLPKRDKRMAILSILDKDRNLFRNIKALISDERLSKIEHLKQVILMLREYVKVGPEERKKFGEVMTDLNLVKHILSRIPEEDFSNPNKTFIDLSNGTGVFPLIVIYRLMKGLEEWEPDSEKRYKHIVENQIFTSEIQAKNVFLYLCLIDPYDEFDLNIYCGSSLDDGLKKHMKDVWNKDIFSYSIGNPPFNQMIDMKFVKLSYEIADVICFVHPATWLLDEKGKQRAFLSTKELVKNHLESIELFNGNKIFNIQLFVPCVITYISKNKINKNIKCFDKINEETISYDNINDINKYSNLTEYSSIKNKIGKKMKLSLHEKIHLNEEGDFYINLSQIRGHVDLNSDKVMLKSDFYTLCTKDLKPSTSKRQQREKTQVAFKFESQADNFLEYVRTNFVRFCLSINKINQNLYCGEMLNIPWLDFNEKWTDENLYKFFDLDENEINFINKTIPKYY